MDSMPRLPNDTVDIAFYLYPTENAARTGTDAGGTGFWVFRAYERSPQLGVIIFVTNKHVLQINRFLRLNRLDGGDPDVFEIEDDRLFPHRGPHDVAIILGYGRGDVHQLRTRVDYTQLLDSHDAAKNTYDIGIGDDVVMVGRFIGHDGRERNRPSVRFGNISVDVGSIYNAEAGYAEESYAVEMRSRPGYSGSAVLVYALKSSTKRSSQKKEFVMCLGVNWGHIMEPRPVLDATGKAVEPKQFIKAPTDMAGVVPSWRIKEIIEYREVRELIATMEQDDLREQPS
jgi:hypothetical protein